jgi:hypothetical protein
VNLSLPVRARGRQSVAQSEEFEAARKAWCASLLQIKATIEFPVSSRGWCYILESHGLAKGDFDRAQALINSCRKDGLLPLNFCAEDSSRGFEGVESLHESTPDSEARYWVARIENAHLDYAPYSFWDDQPCYLQLLVEKVDLKTLFAPVCSRFRIPIANARGWSDINTRANMMRRFKDADARWKRPVLLYCGDHDPAGLLITDSLRQNLQDLSRAVGWSPDNLVIDRFGLNSDFIELHGLTWIDRLQTSSGDDLADPGHKHHGHPHVRRYLKEFGARKCEANALVTRPAAARALIETAIAKYVDPTAPEKFDEGLVAVRRDLKDEIARRLASYGDQS